MPENRNYEITLSSNDSNYKNQSFLVQAHSPKDAIAVIAEDRNIIPVENNDSITRGAVRRDTPFTLGWTASGCGAYGIAATYKTLTKDEFNSKLADLQGRGTVEELKRAGVRRYALTSVNTPQAEEVAQDGASASGASTHDDASLIPEDFKSKASDILALRGAEQMEEEHFAETVAYLYWESPSNSRIEKAASFCPLTEREEGTLRLRQVIKEEWGLDLFPVVAKASDEGLSNEGTIRPFSPNVDDLMEMNESNPGVSLLPQTPVEYAGERQMSLV